MKKENREKFLNLFYEIYPKLERFVLTICFDRDDAKDVVSETMITAYEQFDSLKNKQAFLSYVFTIASRINSKNYKKRIRDKKYEELFIDKISYKGLQPDDETDIQILKESLNQLDEKSKEALVMYEITGLAIKEIAEIQNSSISSIKQRLKRAREKLAKIMIAENNSIRSLQ